MRQKPKTDKNKIKIWTIAKTQYSVNDMNIHIRLDLLINNFV